MSSSYPKSREKRPRTSSENNKSFVKNVASRMSSLLPASIAKWFSSPSSSNTNGSAQATDTTDSSTEDEAPESPIITQPPSKRMRFTSPSNFNQHIPVETRSISTNTESISEYSVNSPDKKNNSQEETTSLSNNNDVTTEQTVQDDSVLKPQESFSGKEKSVTEKTQSWFSFMDDNSNTTPVKKIRDPYFKASLLNSPFYAGRTRYGGAAMPYTPPPINPTKIKLTKEATSNDSVILSHSARNILDLLEHYSSPLTEARRLPQITRGLTKRGYNASMQPNVSPYGQRPYSYKTQELYIPSVANILSLKRKSRLMDTTNAARQIMASHSSTSEFFPCSDAISESVSTKKVSGDKLTTKVMPKLTRINRDRNVEMDSTNTDTVTLPNVVLQIDKDNLPKFTFGPISTSISTQSSSIQTPVIMTPQALKRANELDESESGMINNAEKNKPAQVENNNGCYKFSQPVPVTTEYCNTSVTLPKFSFGNPDKNLTISKMKDENLNSNVSNHIPIFKIISSKNSTDWKCSDCWVMNKIDTNKCISCEGKKPIKDDSINKIKRCSLCNIPISRVTCDKCTECETKANIIDKHFVTKEKNAAVWRCNDCWVDNLESADKCVCCSGKNPKCATESVGINPVEKVDSEWKCADCWIKNKTTLTKCAACGGVKPGFDNTVRCNFGISSLPKDKQDDSKGNSDSIFKSIVKSQSDKWECSFCFVRNESSSSKCICCEADKPGIEKDNCTKFNFHQPTEITFKFGIQPKHQDSIMNEESNMSIGSETNNNVLPKATTFQFCIPGKIDEDVSESSLNKPAETPNMNFKFAAQTDNAVSPALNTIFGTANKFAETVKNTEENDFQKVPQIFSLPQSDEKFKESLGLFNTPVKSQVTPGMPGLVPINLLSHSSAMQKNRPFSTSSTMSTTNSDAKTQQKTFTFGAISPASSSFQVPTTTNASSTVLQTPPAELAKPALPLFQNANNVTTTTASFFQKTQTLPNLGVSLFPTPEATTSTPSKDVMQPIFSFGSSQASVQPQTEKPKFNFNFTNTKTESAPMFKPTFGAPDSNISANAFNLSSNSIISGNAISGNPLNTTPQMNTGDTLTTGNSLTNPSAPSIFGNTIQKENVWSTNTNNMFGTNTTSDSVQPNMAPTFTFGTSTPFNANNTAFGSTTQPAQPTQPAQNIFGLANPTNTSQPSMFGSHVQNQTVPNMFGGPQVSNNPMPMIFGAPNVAVTPSFGMSNQQITPFEPPPQTSAPAPAPFTFGAQSTPGIFGFGQQQPAMNQPPPELVQQQMAPQQMAPQQMAPQQIAPQQMAPQQITPQPAVYNFGAAGAAPQMQFTIGAAPAANTTVRRVRKAIRRTQR